MKIGLVTSGFENLSLFKFLNKTEFDFHIYFDWNNGPYGDKSAQYSLENVKKGINFLINQKVDFIIISPIYEILLKKNNDDLYKNIFPLFSSYLYENCFPSSLVGKLGFIGDFADIDTIQSLFTDFSSDYILNKNQNNIKKFHFPFAIWKKEVYLWKSFLNSISFRSFALSKIIKFDLNYFKDADVDTIIPLNYGYFSFERLIKNKLNQNKTKFHGILSLEKSFLKILEDKKFHSSDKYGATVYCNGGKKILEREKKWMILLQKGKETDVKFIDI